MVVTTKEKQHVNVLFFATNLLCSLSMLYAGASANLKSVIEQVLYMHPLQEEQWHQSYQMWMTSLQSQNTGEDFTETKTTKVGIKYLQAQFLAIKKGLKLSHSFQSNLSYYQVQPYSFDDPNQVIRAINDDVSKPTEGKIPQLIEEDRNEIILSIANPIKDFFSTLTKGKIPQPIEKKGASLLY